MNKYEEKMVDALREVLGGDQKAFSYQKEDAPNKLDIMFAKRSPSRNYLTTSTLGLVTRTTGYKDSNTQKDIRAEIIMSSYGGTDMIGKVLSTIVNTSRQPPRRCPDALPLPCRISYP